jgi:hypothetical protein
MAACANTGVAIIVDKAAIAPRRLNLDIGVSNRI